MREMKDSKIEWVGEIPENWEVTKTKYQFQYKKEIAGVRCNQYERLALTMKNVVKRSKEDNTGLQPEKFETYQILRKDELVFKLIDLQNVSTSRVGRSPFEGLVSPAYIILRQNGKVLPCYAEKYFYILWKNQVFNALGDDGVRSNLGKDDLLNIPLPIPPLSEQKEISEYLDEKCGEIDALLADIKDEIETLEQYKRSVITESVTKGLHPSAPMKNSGIDYIGEVNEEWRITKLGYICQKLNRPIMNNAEALICSNKGKVVFRGDISLGLSSENDKMYQGVEKGDLCIHGMDTWHGAIAVAEMDGKITTVVHCCDSKENKRFIAYYLQMLAFKKVYKTISNGVRGNTSDFRSWDKAAAIYIGLPRKEQQDIITNYLDEKCFEIENIISDKQTEIQTLESYKKSLIYEYVTGKKEVKINEEEKNI